MIGARLTAAESTRKACTSVNGNTVATLHQLFNTTWFSAVGARDTAKARVLTGWEEAVQHCSSPECEELQQETINQYRERVAERSRDRLRR